MGRSARRQTARIVVLSACVLAVAVLFAGVVRQGWVTNDATADVIRAEAAGVEMLHPMTAVLSELVAAQSAAVRGETVVANTLRAELVELAEIDAEHGEQLGTHQRLTDLTSKTEDALRQAETGRAAYETYNGLVTLALNLVRLIGDKSQLIHDPDLDSFYLMDAAIIRLPTAVVLAGRAADLVALAGGAVLVGEDAQKAAVARFGVSDSAEQVSAGLTTSVDATERTVLGTRIADRLDAFKAAADAFAPPTMLAELATTVDAPTLAVNARRVSAAASPLAHLLLSELTALLDERGRRLASDLRFLLGASALILVLGVGIAWLAATRPVRTAGDRADGLPITPMRGSLRDLLDGDELVTAGRARAGRDRPAPSQETGDAR